MSELQTLYVFKLVEKGMKLVISILLCILPVEGGVRGIITTLHLGRGESTSERLLMTSIFIFQA